MSEPGKADEHAPQALENLDSFRGACDMLLSRARRTVRILAPQLDLALLNRESVTTEIVRLTRESRFTDVRVLFCDSLLALRNGHRLVELSRRVPSAISLRRLPEDVLEQEAAWLVVDDRGLLWRASHHRYSDGYVCTNDLRLAPKLARDFDEWWQRAQPDPELRQLLI